MISVSRPSPASRAGIRKGDVILSCNQRPVTDWVDLLSASTGNSIDLKIRRGLSTRNITVKRRPGSQWGFQLDGSKPALCRNRCIFCFVDQQPPGLRSSLLVKDDDVRYSFLQGTYITLTDEQTDEALSRGFNSLHVSVHTTNPVLRGKMLGLGKPAPVLENLDRLQRAGIEVQAQVVEVPDWNSGPELKATISDLYGRDCVKTLGVVPVGLTRWREDLDPLRRPDRTHALNTLSLIHRWQKRACEERGVPWIFAADEYYLLTGQPFPPESHYLSCTLQANGIGLVARLKAECRSKTFRGSGTVVTGTLLAPVLRDLLRSTRYRILPVRNRIMGDTVGVAGLLCGRDVVDALVADAHEGGFVYLPSAMFNHDLVTIDEYSPQDIAAAMNMKAVVLDSPGELP